MIVIFAEPSKSAEPERSPPNEIVLAFASIVAEPAFPDTVPVTLPTRFPSTFATRVPVVIDKLPVSAPVNVPVPIVNLSALSSNPIKAFAELPLSITIPISFAGVPVVPFPNSINLSVIVVLVEAAVVVVPLTVKLPAIVTSVAAISAKVTSEVVATA